MKVRAFVLKLLVYKMEVVVYAFGRHITIARTLLPFFSLEFHVSNSFRTACWVLWFLQKPARYLGSLGSIKKNHISIKQFFKYFWEIRKCTNRPLVTFACCITFLKKTGVISAYFRISGKFHFFTQSLKIFVRAWEYSWTKVTIILKAHSQVCDNFWKIKAL